MLIILPQGRDQVEHVVDPLVQLEDPLGVGFPLFLKFYLVVPVKFFVVENPPQFEIHVRINLPVVVSKTELDIIYIL